MLYIYCQIDNLLPPFSSAPLMLPVTILPRSLAQPHNRYMKHHYIKKNNFAEKDRSLWEIPHQMLPVLSDQSVICSVLFLPLVSAHRVDKNRMYWIGSVGTIYIFCQWNCSNNRSNV